MENKTEDAQHEEVKPEAPAPVEVKPITKNGLNKPPQTSGLTEDELWQWQQSLNDCINVDELTMLYDKNKATVKNTPEILEMFKSRKQQLPA